MCSIKYVKLGDSNITIPVNNCSKFLLVDVPFRPPHQHLHFISRQASVVYDVERVFVNLNYMINNILIMFLLIPVQMLYQHNTFRQAMLFSILSLEVTLAAAAD